MASTAKLNDPGCFEAVIHEGTPNGHVKELGGIECYLAEPSSENQEGDKQRHLLLLTDVFGLPLINNKLLADSFAKNGLRVVMPDLFNGDPAPLSDWNDKEGWFKRHEPAVTIPIIERVLDTLKEQGASRFGAIGYCFGARDGIKFAIDGRLDAFAMAHPSRLSLPSDLEHLKESGRPTLICSCETDQAFPQDAQAAADKIFADSKNYKRTFAPGCSHGFAVRGDMSNPAVKRGKEEAFNTAVEFFQAHL